MSHHAPCFSGKQKRLLPSAPPGLGASVGQCSPCQLCAANSTLMMVLPIFRPACHAPCSEQSPSQACDQPMPSRWSLPEDLAECSGKKYTHKLIKLFIKLAAADFSSPEEKPSLAVSHLKQGGSRGVQAALGAWQGTGKQQPWTQMQKSGLARTKSCCSEPVDAGEKTLPEKKQTLLQATRKQQPSRI